MEEKYWGEWYVVHTYSGYENKIKVDLSKRGGIDGNAGQNIRCHHSEEQEVEYKGGKRHVTTKRVFPGYVIVNMIMDEDPWYVVRHTPGLLVLSGVEPNQYHCKWMK